jgi:hypothetical protein
MAFSLFGKPFGYAAGGRVQAPRTTNVRGQHHKLAYINNEEEALLRARGGTGEKVHGGIPAFPPVKGKTQGKSNAGTGFSGGSSGGSSNNNNEPNRPPVGTGNGGGGGGSGNGGGGGGSDSGQANNPPPSGGNNNNSGNPGDQASGGYGSGNSGGNANSSPPGGGGGGADSGQAAAAEAARRERNRIAAKEAADRKEAQDQAIRDQIERDRAAQVESDRLQRNRAIVMGSQLPADNVYAKITTANDSTLGGQSIQELTQKAKTMGLTVKQGEGGLVLVDLTGQEVGKLADINAIIGAVDNNMEDEAYSNYEDYLKSKLPAQPETVPTTVVPTTTVPATGIASVGTNYGYETNQNRLDKYKLNPDGYAANDTSKEARLLRARNGGMSETDNPRLDKNGNPVSAKDAEYLDAADRFDGGGPGRAGPEFQTKFQSVNNTWAGQEGDTGNIGSTLGITPTGSGRDPTGVAAFVDKGGILGALAGAVLGPNSYVPPNTATTNIDPAFFGNDNNDEPSLSGPPVGGPPAGAPTCPEGYRFDSATNACVLGDASNTDPYQPIITPYTPPPLSAYTPFQPNAPFQPNFQTPSYLPQMPVQQAGIMASTPTQRYLGTA